MNVERSNNMHVSATIIEVPSDVAEKLCKAITSDLPEYFGLPDANLQYVLGVRECKNFAATIDGEFVGLLSLDFPYSNNSRIYWMGILRKFHNIGLGKLLISAASAYALKNGAQSMTVETLAPIIADVNYLNTYHFYEKCGFKPLFNLKPNGYEWEMIYMLKHLDSDQSKFNDLKFTICTNDKEWEIVGDLRQKHFFDKNSIKDPYTWTFNHPEHHHFILYKGTDIIGYAHVQSFTNTQALLRIIVIISEARHSGFGRHFLHLIEKWLKDQKYTSLHTESTLEALSFYKRLDYIEMPFPDNQDHDPNSTDVALGKTL